MMYSEYNGIEIAAISCAVPKEVIDFRAMMENSEEDAKYFKNFIKQTGIVQKRVASMEQTASDFSYVAAKMLEEKGRYRPEEIGVLINVTQTPDYRTPSTALLLHKRLGLNNDCMAFDINVGCAGFVYGVSTGAALLSSSFASKALVLMGDTQARGRTGANHNQSNSKWLFGDGSAAVLLQKVENHDLHSGLMTDGNGYHVIGRPYGGWRHPNGPESVPSDDIAVFNFAINETPALINDFLNKIGHVIDDYDALILHQANKMIIKTIAKRVGAPVEKCPISLDKYGNTSSASVPMTIVDKYGDVNDGTELNLLTSGFGVGLLWGVLDFRIKTDDIYPMITTELTYEDEISRKEGT